MAIYYMDSSGIVKRYIHGIGSVWVPSTTNPAVGNDIFTARVTSVEVVFGNHTPCPWWDDSFR